MVAFLGGGRITSALAAGLRLAGDGREIVVYDRHPDKLKALRRDSRVKTARDVKSAVKLADILVFAVRPGSMKAILEEVVEPGLSPRLCVSLAAGVPLQNLRAWLSGLAHVLAEMRGRCPETCLGARRPAGDQWMNPGAWCGAGRRPWRPDHKWRCQGKIPGEKCSKRGSGPD